MSKDMNVENLFGFVKRTHNFVIGRDNLVRAQKKIKFILVTTDISKNSLEKLQKEYFEIPFVQKYTSEEIETYFQFQKTKVIGFKKSDLTESIYKALKDWRLNG